MINNWNLGFILLEFEILFFLERNPHFNLKPETKNHQK